MKIKILFQGDSITDAAREREFDQHLGVGYPNLVAARLGFEEPEKYEFINRGIGGNRSIDVLARIRSDIINIQPDVMSILMGINDVWHELASGNGVSCKDYEIYYDMLISRIKEALPSTRIMILEPFVLKGPATEEKWDEFRRGTEENAAAAARVAKKHGLPFVKLMDKFDAAAKLAETTYWLKDGVHPTPMGHELIAKEWMKVFKNILRGTEL